MRRRCLGAALLAAPVALGAQTSFTLDAGAARMRFADSIEASALSLSPALRFAAPRASFQAQGNVSHLGDGWSNSGILDATVSTPARRGLSAELAGTAGGSAHSDGTRTGEVLAFARAVMARSGWGAYVGAGGGRSWDVAARSVRQGELGVWLVRDSLTLAAGLAPTSVDTVRYVDGTVTAVRSWGRVEGDASLGVRFGDRLPIVTGDRNVWGNVGVALWVTPTLALVARAGAYPVDYTQGFPGGQFVSLALRIRSAQPLRLRPASPVAGVTRFEVRGRGGNRTIRLYAPRATHVELMGDFTAWSAVSLASEGNGWWSVTLAIAPGTHQLNVRVDGTEWGVPPGLVELRDEFAGTVGLLVIPPQ